ncbi:MAG: hypothetical protein ABI658_28465 [Acidimicrobiales bacterium]
MPRRFGYRNGIGWLPVVIFPIFAIVAIGLIVATVRGSAPVAFTVLWVAALLWNGYWFLLRFGFQVEVVDGVLNWRDPLARRSVPIAELTGNGSMWMGFERLKVINQQSLMVLTRGLGWISFLESLNHVTGSEAFRPTTMNRLAAKMPGSRRVDGYYEE